MRPKPKQDPLLDFLRSELSGSDPEDVGGMRRRWRPSRPKIAGIAAAVLVVLTGAVLLSVTGLRGSSSIDRARSATADAPAVAGGTTARIALVEGDAVLMRSGRSVVLAETDEVRAGDTIESSGGSAVGLAYPDGTAIVVDGEARLNIRKADETGIRVGLVYGTLAARVPPDSRERAPLSIAGSNATLTVRGTVFSVSAERGRLTRAAVSEGEVEVRNTWTDRTFRVPRASRIDMSSWSITGGAPDHSVLGRLARITDGVEIPRVETAEEVPEEPGARPLSAADRIRRALERGDLDEAVKLADKHKGGKSMTLNLAAAEAYRRVGRWSDAVDAYLLAGGSGAGKKAERAVIRAADLSLRKLQKPLRAVDIIDEYLDRFPSGGHLDEALYIGGVASTRSGMYKKAEGLFRKYLQKFPSGSQSAQVHLQLAKIYTLKLSSCSKASKHIKAVKTKAAGTGMAAEADELAARCEKTQ